jgi:hypothetical protein
MRNASVSQRTMCNGKWSASVDARELKPTCPISVSYMLVFGNRHGLRSAEKKIWIGNCRLLGLKIEKKAGSKEEKDTSTAIRACLVR